MEAALRLWAAVQRELTPARVTAALLLLELAGTLVIVAKVPFTMIDHKAYMQEVEGFINGERDYYKLGGDTGPLVYPAAFVYIFSGLYYATDRGENIERGQLIFVGVYLVVQLLVFRLYARSGSVPTYLWVLLCLSKRVHSIFVLRLFNDCVAVLLGYAALLLFTHGRWHAGCALYSVSVGVKMNMLLWAPGVLLVLLAANGWWGTFVCLSICASVQLVLGLPFLTTHPVAYLTRSFELGRVFLHKWTVNLKFLDEATFQSPAVSALLLLLTAAGMGLAAAKWLRACRRDGAAVVAPRPRALAADFVVFTVAASNFIGVAFARTLHFQFLAWYFHTLPLLLWHSPLPVPLRLAALAAVEYAFNVYPSTPASSGVLQAAHAVVLLGIFLSRVPSMLPPGAPPGPARGTGDKPARPRLRGARRKAD